MEKMSKPKMYLDVDTGEVSTLSTVETPAQRVRRESETGWGMVWAAELRKHRLPPRAWMVFWELANLIDLETGVVHYSTTKIANNMGLYMPHVSRCISQLVSQGMAQRIGYGQLRLNPLLFWRGPLSERRDVLTKMKAQSDAARNPS